MKLTQYIKDVLTYGSFVLGLGAGEVSLVSAQTAEQDSIRRANENVLANTLREVERYGKSGIDGGMDFHRYRGFAEPDSGVVGSSRDFPEIFLSYKDVVKRFDRPDSACVELYRNHCNVYDNRWNFLAISGTDANGVKFDIRKSVSDLVKLADPQSPESKRAYEVLKTYLNASDYLRKEPLRRMERIEKHYREERAKQGYDF